MSISRLVPGRSDDLQRIGSCLHLRRPFNPKEKRRQPAQMIKMKVADPDRIKPRPVEIFLRHAMRGIRTNIKQQ